MTVDRRFSRNAMLLTVAAASIALFAYCAGSERGAKHTTIAAIVAHRDTVLDTIRVVEQRLRVDTVRVRVTADGAQKQRAAFDSAARAVEAVAETAPSVPTTLVLPALHVCRQALAADSTAYTAVVATLADMTESRDAEHAARLDDERELKVLKPPRFGFRSGLLVGIAAVAAVVHFVR